jgi:uncharacterized protein (TIGR02453 family)
MSKLYLDFLTELEANNNKAWMDAHKPDFIQVKTEFLTDVAYLLKHVTSWEPQMSALQPKDCVFRQNRDVRFSANKNPYKNNFAAYFAVGGKKSLGPGYYLHIQPGKSFVAGGIWMPPADILKNIRQEIDYSGQELVDLLTQPDFARDFGQLEGDQLKTSPKGYPADHPFIDLLKFKSFIVSKPITDQDIQKRNFLELSVDAFRLMKPFHDFLTRAVDVAEDGADLL